MILKCIWSVFFNMIYNSCDGSKVEERQGEKIFGSILPRPSFCEYICKNTTYLKSLENGSECYVLKIYHFPSKIETSSHKKRFAKFSKLSQTAGNLLMWRLRRITYFNPDKGAKMIIK